MLEKVSDPLKIAVIEDDPLMQQSFAILLQGQIFRISKNLNEFFTQQNSPQNNKEKYDLILLDLRHEADVNGTDTLSRISELRNYYPEAELIIQSGLADVGAMRSCIRQGASRFILKEHIGDEIPVLLTRMQEVRKLRRDLDEVIVGSSSGMKQLKRDLLDLKFQIGVDVLIEGETGCGKELCARALHNGEPFLAVNVSAIPAELFESEFFGAERGAFTGSSQLRLGHFENAGTGTLFLDEIQSLSLAHQAKLLRVIESRRFTRVGSSQERPFKARVVSASNRSLREAVARGQFREDLYYRLAPLTVQVPPLRLRGDDIPLLAHKFLSEIDTGRTKSFTPDAVEFLRTYNWPGNVRELRGLIRSLVIKSPIPKLDTPEIRNILGVTGDAELTLGATGDVSGAENFQIDWSQSFDANVEKLEKFLLTETLKSQKSAEAREKLGLARSRFYEKVKQYGLLK